MSQMRGMFLLLLLKRAIHNFLYYNMVNSPGWCRRTMMTSSNEPFSALLAICAGNSSITGEFPTQRPVTRSFDVFFDLRLNKRLSKQSRGWWFETPSRSLWCHCKARVWYIYNNFFFQIHPHMQRETRYMNSIPSQIFTMTIQTMHICTQLDNLHQ